MPDVPCPGDDLSTLLLYIEYPERFVVREPQLGGKRFESLLDAFVEMEGLSPADREAIKQDTVRNSLQKYKSAQEAMHRIQQYGPDSREVSINLRWHIQTDGTIHCEPCYMNYFRYVFDSASGLFHTTFYEGNGHITGVHKSLLQMVEYQNFSLLNL